MLIFVSDLHKKVVYGSEATIMCHCSEMRSSLKNVSVLVLKRKSKYTFN